MSVQDKGPAYIISLIAGALILVGGLVRAVSVGVLPMRAYGTSFRIMSRAFQAANLNVANSFVGFSAIVGILAGIVVLVGAVMLSVRSRQSVAWGAIVLISSAISFIGGGGFFIGAVLGILAGIIAISWRTSISSS